MLSAALGVLASGILRSYWVIEALRFRAVPNKLFLIQYASWSCVQLISNGQPIIGPFQILGSVSGKAVACWSSLGSTQPVR